MSRSHPHCVLVADDLTGACDSAVQFSIRGARSLVHLDVRSGPKDVSDVDAFSTNSRDLETNEMESRIRAVASFFLRPEQPLVFKKIDSVMRGNPGAEIMATMNAFGCDLAVITPAFPEMGRCVREGRLHLDGEDGWEPIDLLALFRSQGLEECMHVEPALIASAIRHGARYLSIDTTCNDDLKTIVKEALHSGRRILWAGSGGLASAIAGALFTGSATQNVRRLGRSTVLFCIGSDHPATAAQLKALRTQRAACEFHADTSTADGIAAALSRGRHIVLRISRSTTTAERIESLLDGIRPHPNAMFLSGGDTASLVCAAIGVETIEIEHQIVSGLPAGVLRGGRFDGLPIAMKSGGFGDANALLQVADFFTCPKD